jgi:hypothetical protein
MDMTTSKWTQVASDIPVKEYAQMANSSDPGRIAIIEASVLTIRQVTYNGQDNETCYWDVLDTMDVLTDVGNVLSTSVSLSPTEYVAQCDLVKVAISGAGVHWLVVHVRI